jgi:hypothetical protein
MEQMLVWSQDDWEGEMLSYTLITFIDSLKWAINSDIWLNIMHYKAAKMECCEWQLDNLVKSPGVFPRELGWGGVQLKDVSATDHYEFQ